MLKKILLLLGAFSLVFSIALTFFTINLVTQLKKGNYLEASKTANIVLFVVKPISKATFNKSASVELIKNSLNLISNIPAYTDTLSTASSLSTNEDYIFDILILRDTLENLNTKLQTINDLSNKSVIKKISNEKYFQSLSNASKIIQDSVKVLNSLASKDQKVIVVFQNSDEIRATGGFMGSYALVNFSNGKITEVTTEDIYDADGQFTGYIDAPPGVQEFLSGGKGLRLPNANWHPDFPTSAEQILQFFALGNKKNITTLIAVNPEYAKTLLGITGDIILKDYNTVVDSSNVNEVLRSRRSDFFPGSKQKKHLISQLLTQLQIRFSQLEEKSKLSIFQQTFNQTLNKNIQLFSSVPEVDMIFSDYNFRQELEYKQDSEYLFLVESNVGINKANRNISRDVAVEIGDFYNLITVNFKNNNIPPSISNLSNLVDENEEEKSEHMGYINYQRIVVDPSWELEYIKYNNHIISDWKEGYIENSKDEDFKEIGFIITLGEKETSTLEVKFNTNQKNKNKIYVQKQPGLSPIPYIIKKGSHASQIILENNHLFELE